MLTDGYEMLTEGYESADYKNFSVAGVAS